MSLTEEWARQQIGELLPKLALARRIVEDAERHISGIRQILQGFVIVHPDLADEIPAELLLTGPAVSNPVGGEAIRLVMRTSLGGAFTVSAMVDELRNRGLLPKSDNPANAVRTALQRLVDRGEVHKHAAQRPVRYQLIEKAP